VLGNGPNVSTMCASASPGKHGLFTLIVDISFELDILDYCRVDMSRAYLSRP
jgi:hypothetical protein